MATKARETWFNYRVTTADGKIDNVEHRSEKQKTEAETEAAKLGSLFEVTKGQSFTITTADSIDEILQVVPNEKVALGYFNRGLKLEQQTVKRDLMTDSEWAGQEGDYDLVGDVQTEKEQRVADPMATLKRNLRAAAAKVGQPEPTDAEINAVLSVFFKTAQPVA